MTRRPFLRLRLAFVLLVCVLVPATSLAGDHRRVHGGIGVGVGVGGPGWNYPGLPGGPYVTYPWGPSFGWPGFIGATGSYWTNGLSLYGPPVPVYGPIPGVFGNDDLVRQWRQHPGIAQFGWVGLYRASPRPKPPTVSVWPAEEPLAGPAAPGGPCMVLSVKVPQPAAEVLVGGVRTAQTGTDRVFESPPLDPAKDYQYEVTARWVQGGVTMEKTKTVTGKPGEVVRVDFLAPDTVPTVR